VIVTSAEFKLSARTPDRFPRDGYPQIAFMGRSNVGKSSLINKLLGVRGLARTSKAPGRTREIHFYLVNGRAYFVDLPGYGYARVPRPMRQEWKGLVERYLDGAAPPDLAIALVDARHEPTELDVELLSWLRAAGLEHRVVLTKIDKVPRGQRAAAARRAIKTLRLPDDLPPVMVSSTAGDGMPALWRLIDAAAAPAGKRPQDIAPPPGGGAASLNMPETPAS